MTEPRPSDDSSSTEDAPPFRAPLPAPRRPLPEPQRPSLPAAGERLDDFELLRELGVGSFGRVFLARQVSTDRLVALKVSANRGHEARTLARLEHPHIVQIFSETIDEQRGLRFLCMQYVPGMTLEGVLRALAHRALYQRDGRAILEVLDALDTGPVLLDPTALREREFLAGCDAVEAACWLGARLAEALAHAHGRSVLHHDVKPANVLLSRLGRPFLADFNIATAPYREGDEAEALGGSLAYMAPEHLDAFAISAAPVSVGERADLYSLGMMLHELFAGRLPPSNAPRSAKPADAARSLADERRTGPPCLPPGVSIPPPVACVLRRCLQPEPLRRYASAAELAAALDGCCELRRIEKSLPPAGPLTLALRRWPVALGALLALLPHILGSIVNISYNALQIVGRLSPSQQTTFGFLVPAYNAVAYPICIVILLAFIWPVRGIRVRLAGNDPPAPEVVATMRRRLLRLPMWCVFLSCLGWLPGGLLFPFFLDQWSGPVSGAVYGHFLISFTISGLIALTYSFFALQYVVLRVLYPALWTDARAIHAVALEELRGVKDRLGWFQFLAVLIPLAAVVLMVGIGAEGFDSTEYRTFRVLVTMLITLGMTGLGVAMMVSRRLNETLTALTGGEQR